MYAVHIILIRHGRTPSTQHATLPPPDKRAGYLHTLSLLLKKYTQLFYTHLFGTQKKIKNQRTFCCTFAQRCPRVCAAAYSGLLSRRASSSALATRARHKSLMYPIEYLRNVCAPSLPPLIPQPFLIHVLARSKFFANNKYSIPLTVGCGDRATLHTSHTAQFLHTSKYRNNNNKNNQSIKVQMPLTSLSSIGFEVVPV